MSSEIRQQIEAAIKDMPVVTPIGSTRPVKTSLPEAVERIVDILKPEKVILFGSYAYGTPTSDVDLLVVWNTNLPDKSERHWQVSKLLIPRPFPVYKDVVDSGKVLYERR